MAGICAHYFCQVVLTVLQQCCVVNIQVTRHYWSLSLAPHHVASRDVRLFTLLVYLYISLFIGLIIHGPQIPIDILCNMQILIRACKKNPYGDYQG